MEKWKKLLYIPLCYHGALFLTMIILQLMKSNALGFIFLMELCGVVVSPVFYAIWGMCHAILHDGKVFDYFNKNMIYLSLIGLVRVIFYAVFARNTVMFAIASMLVSLAVFSLWSMLFGLTDRMMKKRPAKKKSKRK